jgi:hypothetical protein
MKKLCTFFTLFFFIASKTVQSNSEQWTWLFKKKFSSLELNSNKNKSELVFCKIDVQAFNQLIFSWNAFKPLQGHFTFWAQARDAHTKQWHEWHKMVDWGATIAQSYCTKKKEIKTEYKHVRLEIPQVYGADGLRVKVVAHNGAHLNCIHGLTVNVSNLHNFKTDSGVPQLPSLCITSIPQQSQMVLPHERAEHMCSPTACSMLVSYLNKKPINSLQFAHNVYDKGLDSFGSWPFNTVHAYQECEGTVNFYVTRLNSFYDLYVKLQQAIPVVVSVRGPLEGAPREYKNGHLILVIGWDNVQKKVICHDPAFEANHLVQTKYSYDSFSKAWGRSHNLTYLAEKIALIK